MVSFIMKPKVRTEGRTKILNVEIQEMAVKGILAVVSTAVDTTPEVVVVQVVAILPYNQ